MEELLLWCVKGIFTVNGRRAVDSIACPLPAKAGSLRLSCGSDRILLGGGLKLGDGERRLIIEGLTGMVGGTTLSSE